MTWQPKLVSHSMARIIRSRVTCRRVLNGFSRLFRAWQPWILCGTGAKIGFRIFFIPIWPRATVVFMKCKVGVCRLRRKRQFKGCQTHEHKECGALGRVQCAINVHASIQRRGYSGRPTPTCGPEGKTPTVCEPGYFLVPLQYA